MLKKTTGIIAGLTVLILLNISPTAVHAISPGNTSVMVQTTLKNSKKHNHPDYKSRLDQLVKDGKITKNQEDAVLDSIKPDDFHKFMKKKHKCSKNRLDNLVKNGTITKEQETAVKKLFSISKKQGKNFRYSFNSGLNELVNKGILSKGQKNAVQNLLISCRKEHISNMTEFFRNRLDALVKKGTITQKQEESIIKDLTAFRHAS
ncbi:MAG: hypothetical protein LKJ66_13840 [Clostridium luticellarii]|jgi:polyhydroxyalkanoate synthesis regulator phasin|uniref:hypothetical protein n=1 Tax=Clostridium luticellarii TaxID=1691940 RepID=UPI0023579AEE|nr:hypothetical protein [Clostridium luticellarii]MCI1946545.1 hypothetical protein [Clostridium luticellarii]MCI1996840.1 hypothetical protein [Clostridium luticellarii]MCI2041134.1 hypothetical protein [Clostridium luticellarii]